MNKVLRTLFTAAAAAVFASSVSSCALLAPLQNSEKNNGIQKGGKAVEVPKVGEKLVIAIIENDAEDFLKELPENLVQEFGKKDFEKTRKSMLNELGTPVSYTYLRNMAHPLATISLWVIRFERKTKDPVSGKEKNVVMEVLFRAAYGKIQGKDTLLSFNFY